jgi:FkbH-like protein
MFSLGRKEDTVEGPNSFATLRVRVAATFTAEPLEESLGHWLRKLGFSPDITFAPYGQVFQELLKPACLDARNTGVINLLLVRVEDWFRFASGRLSAEKLEAAVTEFEAALKGFAAGGGDRLLLGLCPHTLDSVSGLGLSEELLEAVDARLLKCVRDLNNGAAIDLRRLTDTYTIPRVLDEEQDRLGHIPFTPEFFAAMGAQLARWALTGLHSPLKVLVLDCDNTLWKGVCGEDGPHGVEITAELAELQEFLLRQQQGGRLLCLCSKNNEADVWEVFDHNPRMRLKRSHIIASRINWRPKSENIFSLSRELNLGLESFLLIDDDPSECAEVEHMLPGVSPLCLPTASNTLPVYLRHHWAFDAADATDEDRKRTELYRQNAAREGLRAQVTGHEEFIRQLRVETEIDLLRREDLPRAAQLTQRTNQFNATSVRRTEAGLSALAVGPLTRVMTVRVRDRFGDYGLVGLMIVSAETSALVCETFLLSCRVLGKEVEHEMVRHLAGLAAEWGLAEVQLRYRPSEKNHSVRVFFEAIAQPLSTSDGTEFRHCFAAASAEAVLAAARSKYSAPQNSATAPAAPGNDLQPMRALMPAFNEIALMRGDVAAMLREMRSGSKSRRVTLKTEFVPPRTSLEKELAAIWSEALSVERVGVNDSFFDLGGYSIKAIQVVARVRERFGVELPLGSVIESRTVARFAERLEDALWLSRRPHEDSSPERVIGEI